MEISINFDHRKELYYPQQALDLCIPITSLYCTSHNDVMSNAGIDMIQIFFFFFFGGGGTFLALVHVPCVAIEQANKLHFP